MEKLEKVLRKLNREIENMYNDGTLETDQYNLLTDDVNKALVLFGVGSRFNVTPTLNFEREKCRCQEAYSWAEEVTIENLPQGEKHYINKVQVCFIKR